MSLALAVRYFVQNAINFQKRIAFCRSDYLANANLKVVCHFRVLVHEQVRLGLFIPSE
jgi:hypothetical protein